MDATGGEPDMFDEDSVEATPKAAKVLGAAGALPFVGLALLAVAGPTDWHDFASTALIAYGAVILSFLGGIQWGLAIAADVSTTVLVRRLSISVIPSLIGWLSLLAARDVGLILVASTLLVVLAIDVVAVRSGEAPGWYTRLRWPLTLAAATSLTLAVLA